MSSRRFIDKPDLDPSAVRALPDGHAALVENRTLFPTTVVDVDEDFDGNILVSGRNSRKLGKTVTKGKFKGYAIYSLTLEERATCPDSCSVRDICYGNGMQLARRHRIADPEFFYVALENEIRELLEKHKTGILIRLHVLGDFPSVEYVGFWADMLEEHPKLAVYGYTHRFGDEIGEAIEGLKNRQSERFRIRWSATKPRPDGASIIDYVPKTAKVLDGLVCPAQTDATACCASCGLCWEKGFSSENIVFVKHGPKSLEQASRVERDDKPVRPIKAIQLPAGLVAKPIVENTPSVKMVKPTDLIVEGAYQRDLSGKSIKLIRKIVANWDWSKFKPPVCALTPDGLYVMDGQHTAIAAASHPHIKEIPVLIAPGRKVEKRAEAFVAHNRDRLNMTPAQIFYGELASGNPEAKGIMEVVVKAEAAIPRLPVATAYAAVGQVSAIAQLRQIYRALGAPGAERLLKICVLARQAPISQTVMRGLREVFKQKVWSDVAALPDAQIAAAVSSIPNLDLTARNHSVTSEQNIDRACAELIAAAAHAATKVAA